MQFEMTPNRVAIVTGGTSGVGKSIAKALVARGFDVWILGRDRAKGNAMVRTLMVENTGKARFIQIDLSDLGSVRAFTKDFAAKSNRLDVLANVAGLTRPERAKTTEGFEQTFATGYLSAFVLSTELQPALAQAKDARIINVAAASKPVLGMRLDLEDLSFAKDYDGFRVALASVHAKAVMTQILAAQYAGSGISVLSFNPGVVRSDLMRNHGALMRRLYGLASAFMARESACGIYAATKPDIGTKTGMLLDSPQKALPLDFDKVYAAALWDRTRQMLEAVAS